MFSRRFATILTLVFLIQIGRGFSQTAKGDSEEKSDGRLFALIEDKLEGTLGEYINDFTKWLEKYNDKHLAESELGRILHYDVIKPNLENESARSHTKKMSMSMMPLIFHVGAMSTWMMLTSIMAAKGVMIGLILLVFKIAVSAAKLASFFTLLKAKHHDHGWSWSPPPHFEHHGHDRSFSEIDNHPTISNNLPTLMDQSSWHSYAPEWTPNEVVDYHTIPSTFKGEESGPYLKADDRKVIDERRKKFTR